MFNLFSRQYRKHEEELFNIVSEEIENEEINQALWTKAVANSGNNKGRTMSLYIKYRVQN